MARESIVKHVTNEASVSVGTLCFLYPSGITLKGKLEIIY